ncbi:NAD(P)/FAD-dependent oxidoreductase [Halalkalibacter krulwichiae]|uniref:Thioredoxin reductase n=1 Tax=Halalkalibacter krulwichiae TaxID=199441 RepID=A0A1X9M825_9BACI|nr:NAD(P)/FAD-dependent oxidoreductase [Halalkalibacter krulwichiae]ARK29557.1 Thioredoxin reductase [Halalkalibacter krulwichiae]
MIQKTVDVVIIGGGPGGLNAALVLGRSRRSVVLIDAAHPRNEVTYESHGFLTRDGIKPFELRELAHEQMKKYSNVTLIRGVVKDVLKEKQQFKTMTETEDVIFSRKVIFATGLKEDIPSIEGLQDVYGKTVFSCPYCDAWEHRDQPIVLIGNTKQLIHQIRLIYNWSKDLIVATNGPAMLNQKEKLELNDHNIRLIETPIEKFKSQNSMLEHVVFTDGEMIHRKAGFIINTGATQASMLPQKLGVKLNEKHAFETQEHGKTKVSGLFIIGDAAKRFTGLIGAASEGYETAVFLNKELVEEDW